MMLLEVGCSTAPLEQPYLIVPSEAVFIASDSVHYRTVDSVVHLRMSDGSAFTAEALGVQGDSNAFSYSIDTGFRTEHHVTFRPNLRAAMNSCNVSGIWTIDVKLSTTDTVAPPVGAVLLSATQN
jgi:hypothetical protein